MSDKVDVDIVHATDGTEDDLSGYIPNRLPSWVLRRGTLLSLQVFHECVDTPRVRVVRIQEVTYSPGTEKTIVTVATTECSS